MMLSWFRIPWREGKVTFGEKKPKGKNRPLLSPQEAEKT
jgi:hypothetical protein